VPLSDRERKLLAEMEQALSADDPRLSSTLTGNRTFPGRGRVLTGMGKGPRMAKEKKGSGLRSRLEQRWDERNFDN
jgi:hypothetical protein